MVNEGGTNTKRASRIYNRYIKRAGDLILSTIALILLLPLLIIIAILIKTSSKGEILFVQKRLGQNGKIFNIYKFRTMIQDAEKVGTGIYTSHDDPRITRIGHFLRKTSLDELPQIFNVLKGDMSLVGPRPPVPYHPHKYEEYSDCQRQRFEVLPGITGYAQVIGRNTLTWDERIELDIQYIQQISFLLDLKILIKTLFVFTNEKQIYNFKKKTEKDA